jgi:hypothetical protein
VLSVDLICSSSSARLPTHPTVDCTCAMGVALKLAAGAFVPNMANPWKFKQLPGHDAKTVRFVSRGSFLLALPSLGALEALDVHGWRPGACPTPITSAKPGQRTSSQKYIDRACDWTRAMIGILCTTVIATPPPEIPLMKNAASLIIPLRDFTTLLFTNREGTK